jgi:RNA polymerase sigma factor (sigma-70 family)
MTKQRSLTQNSFDQLLMWLDADREQAARKYEDIRHSLIKILVWNGCYEAEDLADETIDRVTRRVPELIDSYEGDPKSYFYAVAKRLLKEWYRRQACELPPQTEVAPSPEMSSEAAEAERLYECTDLCLRQLSDADRQLILLYYQKDKQAKIDARKQLASDLNIGLNALRVKVHRLRAVLHECIERCLGREADDEMD